MIEEFVRFAVEYDSAFEKKIAGANAAEIAELESLVGVPLPPEYREYLLVMGQRDGGIELAYDGTTDIVDIIEYYREYRSGQAYAPVSGCVVIGTGDMLIGRIFLEDGKNNSHKVFMGLGSNIDRLYGESLRNVLYRRAFIKYELAQKPFSAFYIAPMAGDLMEPAQEILKSCDLQVCGFSDSECLCAKKDSVSVIIERSYKTRGLVKIAASSRQFVLDIGNVFESQMGLSLWRWWKDA